MYKWDLQLYTQAKREREKRGEMRLQRIEMLKKKKKSKIVEREETSDGVFQES